MMTGTWSTARLSVPRYDLAATSIGNVALFAGGNAHERGRSSVVDIYNSATGGGGGVRELGLQETH